VLQTDCELIGNPAPYQRDLEHADSDGNGAVRSSTSRRRTIVASPFLSETLDNRLARWMHPGC
jgi:hypothetical protein